MGLRRSGKTSLLRYIKERIDEFCQPEQNPLIVILDLQYRQFHTPEGILEGLRREIKKTMGEEPWSRESNDDPFEVEDGLQILRDQGYRLIVMFDEFEAIARRLGLFQDWGEDWRAKNTASLLTTVITSKRPVSETYTTLQLTSPFGNIFSTTILGALAEDDWQDLVRNGFGRNGELETQDLAPLQTWIDYLSGGLPYYVQMASSMLWQYDNLDQAKREFIFQAKARFQELWDDLTDAEHHHLRFAADIAGLTAPNSAVTDDLKRHGLLRSDGRLFSRGFAEFIRGQR